MFRELPVGLMMAQVGYQGLRNLDLRVHAVCSIEESSGPQNPRVLLVLRASKSAGNKGDVPKIKAFMHPLH